MNTFLQDNMWLFIISLVWVLPWKGYALWTASHNKNKLWFIAILILNTFAILEIFYIFYVAKKTPKDIIKSFKSKI
jgi:membrane protein YdbS with pleckstrin-like domain